MPLLRSHFAPNVLYTLFFAACALVVAGAQQCSPIATLKYPGNSCSIVVDRSLPGSPLPVQVPGGTSVTISVTNQRKIEIIKTVTSTDSVATPDVFGNSIKQFVSPLASVIVLADLVTTGGNPPPTLSARQIQMQGALQSVSDDVFEANQRLSCLQTFTVFDSKNNICTQAPLPTAAFDQAFQDTKDAVFTASTEALPYAELKILDADVTSCTGAPANCPTTTPTLTPDPNLNSCNVYLSNEAQLDSAIKTVAASQATLAAFGPTLDKIDTQTATVIPPITNSKNHKATVQLTAQEQVGKTSVAVATVVITWQQTNWSLSTGIVGSSLKNKTYNNSPIYINGAPSTDGSGHTYTQVTVSKTLPGVISPVIFANYRLHNFQPWQGRTAILVSTGVGPNFATKSADFAVGPSWLIQNFIISGVLHYGRQAQLTNGVHVGDQLGTNPPTLPAVNQYKPAWGIGLTYRLPIQ